MSSTSTTPSSRRRLVAARALIGVLAVALVLGSGCGKGGSGGKAGARAGEVGSTAPEFALPDLDGRVIQSADYRGKVVILDFWATWCPPCRKEIPHFVALQSKYRGKGVEVVGLSLDKGGAQEVRPFAEENNVNYTMLIANQETTEAFGGITGIPTTFILDKEGKIAKRFLGYTDPAIFEETIQHLLSAS